VHLFWLPAPATPSLLCDFPSMMRNATESIRPAKKAAGLHYNAEYGVFKLRVTKPHLVCSV